MVGMGPGNIEEMTLRAYNAIREADFIVGYTTYINLLKSIIDDKKIISTGMMREVERCKKAIELAKQGNNVAVISSGDAGIYGMAGLILELVENENNNKPEVEIIPGLSAVNVAASILGAPLMHDFAVISLSDLMTPWDLIKKRVELAAQGDMVIAIYNPKSKKRVKHIEIVREIVSKYRNLDTPVGIVHKAGRIGQNMIISNLENFTKEEIDMQTLVIIGNSQTYIANNKIITPRGYKL